MSSTIELDQDDITDRLMADTVVSAVKVFSQRKGVTENDVQTALGATNSKAGKSGLVAIVLIPKIITDAPDAPGPRYFVRYTIQVIDWPIMRRTAHGAQLSAETLCERIRSVIHQSQFGRGQALFFDGMEPAPTNESSQVAYLIHFKRLGADPQIIKPANVAITPKTGAAPILITMTCATGGATIYYTIDGSYPSPTNTSAIIYSAPFMQVSGATIRATATAPGYQQGDVVQAVIAPSTADLSIGSGLGGSSLGSTPLE